MGVSVTTTLSLNEIRKRCARLVVEWHDEPGDERQQAQSFIRDLLAAYGVSKTKAALYEKRAKRSSTGNQGYIDALVPGLCLIEMKSAGKDLGAAERQALDYVDALSEAEAPRWVITSDFQTFRVLDLMAGQDDTTTFALSELPHHVEDLAFLAGYQTREFGSREQEQASIKAARIMADLYGALSESGYDDHEASVFLVRVLFCLYADDSGVWERDLFYEYLERRTSEDGDDLGPKLAMLFQTMNQPLSRRSKNLDELMARFPYVNGGIFAEPAGIPSFSHEMRDLLLDACSFNWSAISPAIFGSLFQAVKSAEDRRKLGAHYTTETNILKTIAPLFLDELQAAFTQAFHDKRALKKLRRTLGDIQVLDPACGCGNFLVIAYREMRALDLRILQRLQELGDTSELPTLLFTKEHLPVTLDHFAGIEIEEWPARIASTALHLVDHQANQAMELALGVAPDPLPLGKVETIHVANALRYDWSTIFTPDPSVRVIGNPPFIGHHLRSEEQAADLKHVWGTGYNGYFDYVTGWFKKAIDYFGHVPGRFAFVSTNSIAQGQPVTSLFRPVFDAGWRIRFAHQTFAWSSEAPGAAAVHCVITGFDRQEKTPAVLFGYETIKAAPRAVPVKTINPYLVDGPAQFVTKRPRPLSSALPPTDYGSKAADGKHLTVKSQDYETFVADAVTSKYLRRYIGAKELINSLPRWCLWLEDLDPADVSRSPLLRERLEGVRAMRLDSDKEGTRDLASTPHLFAERRQPRGPYLGIPRHVAEDRPYFTAQRFGPEVICSDANFTAPDPDGFAFAVMSSSMFLAWQAAVGGRIKSDYRFANTLVWNTLPLPEPPVRTREQIIAAGKQVLEARALHPERSLAEHYNPLAMDPALLRAHQHLDKLVDKAFGATVPQRTMEDRQTTLFKRYVEMTGSAS